MPYALPTYTTQHEIEYLHSLRKLENGERLLRQYRSSLPFRSWNQPGMYVDVFEIRLTLMRLIGEPNALERIEGVEDYERVILALADKRFKGRTVRSVAHRDILTCQ